MNGVRRILLLSLLALVPLGCGGGDDRLSAEEFRRQANEACRELGRETEAVAEPQSLAEVEAFATRLADVGREGRVALGELEPPEELEGDYDRLLENLDETIAIVERLGDAAADRDEAEVDRLANEIGAKDAEADRIARKLRLDVCAAV